MNASNETEAFSFTWEIENVFNYYCARGECHVSPEFFINAIGPIHIEFYPEGDFIQNDEYYLLNLITTCDLQDFSIDCDLKYRICQEIYMSLDKKIHAITSWKFKIPEFPTALPTRESNFNESPGTLVIVVKFYSQEHTENSYQVSSRVGHKCWNDIKNLSDEIKVMCCKAQHSDFVLNYQDVKFPLHKAILLARVQKLADDLNIYECIEATVDVSTLSLVTPDIFRLFLEYVYSGELPLLSSDVVIGLHQLSNIYDVTVLKEKLRSCPTSIVARSVVKADHKTFTWPFSNLDKRKDDDIFSGPVFSSGVVPSSDFYFSATFEKKSEEYEDLKIKISHLYSDNTASCYGELYAMVLNTSGKESHLVGIHYFNGDPEWNSPSVLQLEKVNDTEVTYNLRNGDNLLCLARKEFLLQVDFIIYGKPLLSQTISSKTILTSQQFSAKPLNDITKFSRNIGDLYNRMTDVDLYVGDVRFPVHTVIIAARSPVFSKMFEHEMLEKKEKIVHISDIDDSTLGSMLTYMYSGRIDKAPEYDFASKLYAAADKYDVKLLKKKCSMILQNTLTEANALRLFCLADMHSDANLKAFVIDYICKYSNVKKLPEWKVFIRERRDLASDILLTLNEINLSHKEACNTSIQ